MIITSFRDARTYTRKYREIGEREFYINRNTAYQHCLNKERYIRNNIDPYASDYSNENETFSEFYNCTIVVPIVFKYENVNLYYGYLCCDTQNEEYSKDIIFNDQVADIMIFAAKIIAKYIDEVDNQIRNMLFDDSPELSLLILLYQDKFKG